MQRKQVRERHSLLHGCQQQHLGVTLAIKYKVLQLYSIATGAGMDTRITSRVQTAQGVSTPPSPVSAAPCGPASAVVSAAASMQQPNPLLKLAPVTLTHTDGVAADAQTKHLRFGRLSMQMVQD